MDKLWIVNYITNEIVSPAVNLCFAIKDSMPGSKLIIGYIKNSYQNDPFRILLEGLLVFFAIKYYFHKKYKPNTVEIKLTEKVNLY